MTDAKTVVRKIQDMKPVFPLHSQQGADLHVNWGIGLRAYLAAKAMTAMPPPTEYMGHKETEESYRVWARRCVRMADALTAELEKS